MIKTGEIEKAYAAYHLQEWKRVYDLLSEAAREERLDAQGFEILGNAAYLIAEDEDAAAFWARAHNEFVDRSDIASAARTGFLLSLTSLLKGGASVSSGWLARTQRLLDTSADRHVEVGFCDIILGLRQLFGGDPESALQLFDKAVACATEFQNPDLLALSLLGQGQALIANAEPASGADRLDEAMVLVTSGRTAPIYSGIVYCGVILSCQGIYDIERAYEWTTAFDQWCAPQHDLVAYRGQCLIHRSEILQMRGDWPAAMQEAERACTWLSRSSDATTGRAHYQKAELHRLFGEYEFAENAYQEAVGHGIDPQPGHALLLLGGGQTQAAAAAIRTAYDARPNGRREDAQRLKLLRPLVDILLAAGELEFAQEAAKELAAKADYLGKPWLRATSATALGAVLSDTGRFDDAHGILRQALDIWQQLGNPYEIACTRVLLSRTCAQSGDAGSAKMFSEAARASFLQLGAKPDLASLDRMPWQSQCAPGTALTGRQIQVLRLIAEGRSNRQIAAELGISEHTVARHISNIFDRTGVSSRAAAVAFAHTKNLLN